jgi:hypothetical protein
MVRAAGVAILAAAVLGGGAALGSSPPTLNVRARPHVVEGGRMTTISGRLRGGGVGGARVVLEVRAFPFATGFVPILTSRTHRYGRFTFTRRPARAARYRVVVRHRPAVRSRGVQVFAEPRIVKRRCNLCGVATARPGRHTLRYRFDLHYPAAAYRTESPKRVFFYFGQRNGSGAPPRRLRLVKTVRQAPIRGNATRVRIRHRVHLPRVYGFRLAACTRTSEARDGVGLPGPPGSHGCGRSRIGLRQSRHWLG